MDRHMRLTCFYFVIFSTLFFSSYTISVYNPKHIIDEIINLTDELIEKIPHEIRGLYLSSPLEYYWREHHECLRTYLNTFKNGVDKVSEIATHKKAMIPIIEHIKNCIQKLKQHCAKIEKQPDRIEDCENQMREKKVYIFMNNFLDFSNFLNNLCHNTVYYKDYYYVNKTHNAC